MTPCGSAGAAAVSGTTCVADGGIETVLIFDRGLDLPCFASFPLLADKDGRDELLRYFEPYARLAADRGLTADFDTPTWRANADWGAQLGYAAAELDQANKAGSGAARAGAGLGRRSGRDQGFSSPQREQTANDPAVGGMAAFSRIDAPVRLRR